MSKLHKKISYDKQFKALEKLMYKVARKHGLSKTDAEKYSKIPPKQKKVFIKSIEKR